MVCRYAALAKESLINPLSITLREIAMDQFKDISPFESYRLSYAPPLPAMLENITRLKPVSLGSPVEYDQNIQDLFPHTTKLQDISFENTADASMLVKQRVGVVFSGGQAPGGNNVIAGLFDALKKASPASELIGFLGGPSGLIQGKHIEITKALLARYRNLGGFDLLGSDRTKLDAPTHAAVLKCVQDLELDGLVIIGGDDSNTNAALLAEYFLVKNAKTSVVGIPKTIDGDLKSSKIEASFGFDTATKTYADIIGNLAKDALSAKKYYFFVKLMGRTASSIALECALQTHPNYTLIGEEILEKGLSLQEVVNSLADLICERAARSKNYGLILVPEGLLEFIPDCKLLIKELSSMQGEKTPGEAQKNLSEDAKKCFEILPAAIKKQLLLDLDPHGNLQVSRIETERLLIEMVEVELKKRQANGRFTGNFNPQPLFLGYEGRSCAPSNFDANYCYALGRVATILIQNGLTGYMAAIKGLSLPVESWQPFGIPLVSLVGFEERKGIAKPVIKKALVDLKGGPFASFKKQRQSWAVNDDYRHPGPIQHFGSRELTEQITLTLALEQSQSVEI